MLGNLRYETFNFTIKNSYSKCVLNNHIIHLTHERESSQNTNISCYYCRTFHSHLVQQFSHTLLKHQLTIQPYFMYADTVTKYIHNFTNIAPK